MSRIPLGAGIAAYPWYKSIVFWAVIMMLAYAYFYVIFW
jgi:hypothetical protein